MRIGLSTSVIQRGQTGIAQYLFALLRALLTDAERRHEFILFVLEEDLPLFDFATDAVLVPVPERFRPPLKNIWWHQVCLPALVRRFDLDALHVPSYRRMLWPQPCPLVATIHDLAPFHVAGKYDWKRMFYGRVIARRLAQRQTEIIAASENTAQDLVRFFGLSRQNVTVVLNGLDHARFFPGNRQLAQTEVAQRHGLTRPYFVYVARLEHPGKNHVRLIAAFNQFKAATGSDWQLALGGSDWQGAEQIHRAIDSSPFAADIRRLGFVPDTALPDLYRAAEALVYPSLYEGFGMPPTEAMACGCPVICSTRGSLGEVTGNAAVAIDPEDVNSIARQLTEMAGDASRREELRRAGGRWAQRFDWAKAARETVRVYERAAQRHAGSRRAGLIRDLESGSSMPKPSLEQNS